MSTPPIDVDHYVSLASQDFVVQLRRATFDPSIPAHCVELLRFIRRSLKEESKCELDGATCKAMTAKIKDAIRARYSYAGNRLTNRGGGKGKGESKGESKGDDADGPAAAAAEEEAREALLPYAMTKKVRTNAAEGGGDTPQL
jgi:hypothetical protein